MVNNEGPVLNLYFPISIVDNLPPGDEFFSKTSTSKPLAFNLIAVDKLPIPEPIIITLFIKNLFSYICNYKSGKHIF